MEPITAIVESPKGSGQKFDYEPEMNLFKLKKVLPAGLVFPFDFGFIPDTLGEDGDPLDVMVISEFHTFTGCVMECRLIGAITAKQTERNGEEMRNDRFIGVPVVSEQYEEVNEVDELPKQMIGQLQNFFMNYNDQAGKKFEPFEVVSAAEAMKLISEQWV
jgi:inorganic pyrophosphatase